MVFDVIGMLQSAVGYKGLPFPGVWFSGEAGRGYTGNDFKSAGDMEPGHTHSNTGTILYKKDLQGNYYFMPVVFLHKGKEYEIDCAMVSITGKKNIIETPLVGRKGSVKELISIDDYQINIFGMVIGWDGVWPEDRLDAIDELYNINEAVELKCALTDVFFSENDKVVISEINIPQSGQTEHTQIVELKCTTDRAFELTIE